MIYITGDCHQDYRRFSKKAFPQQKEMTKDDYVIICGDFGGIWNRYKESEEEKSLMDFLESRPFTTLFADGNHENFDRLYDYPVEEWHGGKVHKIRPSVIHLMRGQVFEIDGKKIFAFGGAACHDIDGGILDLDDPEFRKKKQALDREWQLYRINHLSWWKQELPTQEEIDEGKRNLEKNNNTVDYIITHCCSSSTQRIVGDESYDNNIITEYFEEIKKTVSYRKWFFGHYHDNVKVNDKEMLLYRQIMQVE